MAELTIRPDDIRDALQRFVSDYEPETATREEVGIIAEAGDGIAIIEGLPSAMANELLEFEDGTLGLALNLDVRSIGAVVLGRVLRHRGRASRYAAPVTVLSVPVG
jgi:F-type H+-transporting ATPase subunit alpha